MSRYLKVQKGKSLSISQFPNFSATGSITGMKAKFYGPKALLVRCGSWIYNVTSCPKIYEQAH